MSLALTILILALSAAVPIALLVRWLLRRRAMRSWHPGPEVTAAVQDAAEALASPRTDLIRAPLPAGVRPSVRVGCFWTMDRAERQCMITGEDCSDERSCEHYDPGRKA